MEEVPDGYKASDLDQTSIKGPKFKQEKGKHSQHALEVIELDRLEIVGIRFAALGGAWIRNRQPSLCIPLHRDSKETILPVFTVPWTDVMERIGVRNVFISELSD